MRTFTPSPTPHPYHCLSPIVLLTFTRRLCLLPWLLLLVLGLVGCGGLDTSTRSGAPAYTRTTEHYRTFADADALAAYLSTNSAAGPLISAHRGGPMRAYPENALATFEHALRYTAALIECDVRMSRDSVLVLMHDETLDRTTTGEGNVTDYTFATLRKLLLVDELGIITPFRIPTLDETLAWAQGRAVLTLDIKQGVPPEAVVRTIRRLDAANRAVVITYSLEAARRYHRLAPELMISASARTLAEAQALLDSDIDPSRLIAFTGVGEVKPDVIELLRTNSIRPMLGTFGLVDERAQQGGAAVYQTLIERGIGVIATDLVPLAAEAVEAYRAVITP